MALVEAFMYRCHPQTIAVVEAVRSGAIGELKLIRSSFCFNVRETPSRQHALQRAPKAAGALMDVGLLLHRSGDAADGPGAPTAMQAVRPAARFRGFGG